MTDTTSIFVPIRKKRVKGIRITQEDRKGKEGKKEENENEKRDTKQKRKGLGKQVLMGYPIYIKAQQMCECLAALC